MPRPTSPPALAPPDRGACCVPLQAEALGVDDARALAVGFAALGDPVRLQLLSILATSGPQGVCVCDLVAPVGRSQPTVSHHLKVLRDAGLVTSERRGTNHWYAAQPAALAALCAALLPAGEDAGAGGTPTPAAPQRRAASQ